MINDDHVEAAGFAQTPDDTLASLRTYLLYIAEQHLGTDLHAKGGASDLVQTALLAAHQADGQARARSPEQRRGWLRQILLNTLRKFRGRWRGRTRDVSREVALDRLPARQPPPAHHETPSHFARAEEQKQHLTDAVGRLPGEQQQILAMHLDEELSFVEIGRRLGRSPDAIRMAYGRALERLRLLLPPALA